MEKNMKNNKDKIKFLLKLSFCFTLLLIIFLLLPGFSSKSFATEQETSEEFCYLSDIAYIKDQSSVGWGSITLDQNLETKYNKGLITLIVNGEQEKFLKGISAHATSTLVYDISDLDYDYFSTYYGVDASRGTNGNGVKFSIYTSVDGENWDLETSATPPVKKGNSEAEFIEIDIRGKNYIKLYAHNNGNQDSDHAVYANAKLYKDGYVSGASKEYNKIHDLQYYDDTLSAHDVKYNYENNYRLILEREFVRKFDYEILQAYANIDKDTLDTLDWILSDDERLEQVIEVGEITGTLKFLNVVKDIYTKYKAEFETENGYVYQKMLIGLAAAYSTDANSTPLTFSHLAANYDYVERFEIVKDLFDNHKLMVMPNNGLDGEMVENEWFKDYHVELMRMVMQEGASNIDYVWLNGFTHDKKSISFWMVPYISPNYNQARLYDEANRETYDAKYFLTKYNVPFGDKVQRFWMVIEAGGICWNESRFGQAMYRVNGIPATGGYQPSHEPFIQYYQYENGDGFWTPRYGSWSSTGTKWGGGGRYRYIFDWANKYFADQNISGSKGATSSGYLYLAQENLNNYEKYKKSVYYNLVANSYTDNNKKLETYLESLKVNDINLDTYDYIISIYKNMSVKNEGGTITSADWFDLAGKIIDAYDYNPVAMYDLLAVIRPYLEGNDRLEVDRLEKETLKAATNATQADNLHAGGVREHANQLLGKTQPDPVTFSFDGANAGKLVKNPNYSISYGYSLDGGVTFSEYTTEDSVTLTKAEIESITAENNIIIRFLGLSYTFTINITENTLPSTVYASDLENRVLGVNSATEWRYTEEDEWTSYSVASPDLTGNKTVQLRQSATGTKVTSAPSEIFTFTEDNQPDTRKYIPVSHLSIHSVSTEATSNGGAATNAIDANYNTRWHSAWNGTDGQRYIVIKLDKSVVLSAVEYVPAGGGNGKILDGTVLGSMDGENWVELAKLQNLTYTNAADTNADAVKNTKAFEIAEPKEVQYVKIVANRASNGNWFTARAFNLYQDLTKNPHPTAGIAYSTTESTNEQVVARLVNPSTEITITNNGGSDTYIFTENGEFTFEFVDRNGNKGTAEAKVTWIDKDGPTADVDYVLDADKKLHILLDNISEDVYLLDEDNNKINYIEVENGKITDISYLDNSGNIYKVIDIDEQGNNKKITYKNTTGKVSTVGVYVTTLENGEVVNEEYFDNEGNAVTITDEEKQDLRVLQESSKSNPLELALATSGEYEFKLVDKAENLLYKSIKVDYISNNTTILASDITYNITNLTNKDVIATINPYIIDTTGKHVSVEMVSEGEKTHTFIDNGEFTFRYKSSSDTESSEVKQHIAKVDWIDKIAPTAQVSYSTTEATKGEVVATLTNESEEIIITNNGTSRDYTFDENGQFTFKFEDKAGNKGTAVAKVDWIIEDTTVTSSKYKVRKNYISRIPEGTTVKEFKENVESNEELVVTDKDGKVLEETDTITVGMILKAGEDKQYKLIIAGDVDQDGLVTVSDLLKLKLFIVDLAKPTDIEGIAADLNENGMVEVSDLLKLKMMTVGL